MKLFSIIAPLFFVLSSSAISGLPVDLEDARPPGVVVSSLLDLNVLPEPFLSHLNADDSYTIHNTEIIAWALKYGHGAFPPQFGDECIILFSFSRNENDEKWALLLLHRLTSAGRWLLSWNYDPFLAWNQTFDERPSSDEIASFIKGTNFGYNSFSKGEVLKVVLYVDDNILMEALSNPVSDEEKDLRREISESFAWNEPLPNWAVDLVGNTYHYSKGLADAKAEGIERGSVARQGQTEKIENSHSPDAEEQDQSR